LWQALIEAGGKPFGLEAIDIARVEAGLIIIALDYQPGGDLAVRRIARPLHQAGDRERGLSGAGAVGADPPKRLRLTIEVKPLLRPGRHDEDGDEVGTVTSPVVSPRLGTIALAVLDTASAGTARRSSGAARCTVAPLSLFDPERGGRRSRPKALTSSSQPEDGRRRSCLRPSRRSHPPARRPLRRGRARPATTDQPNPQVERHRLGAEQHAHVERRVGEDVIGGTPHDRGPVALACGNCGYVVSPPTPASAARNRRG
jgi:hypothetical protein